MYLLDSNTFVEAKNKHYRMSFCPAYWNWIDASQRLGLISSISLVYDELIHYGDELSTWVSQRKEHFLEVDDEATQMAYVDIAQFVADLAIAKETEKARFLSGADPWLIAKAVVTGSTIVTHELAVPANSTKVKIPNICNKFGVSFIDTYDLLETLKASFVLSN